MLVTEVTIVLGVLSSIALLVIPYSIQKTHTFSNRAEFSVLVALYVLCAARMLLPFNFRFTKGILIEKGIYVKLYEILCLKRYTIMGFQMKILYGLCTVWFVVAFVLILKFVWKSRKEERMIYWMEVRTDEQCKRVMDRIVQEKGACGKVTVRVSKDIVIPSAGGIRKKTIFLPDQKYSDEELYYILSHEYMHLKKGDVLTKYMMEILSRVFWWNPFSGWLKQNMEENMEIRCDLSVTERLTREKAGDYLAMVLAVMQTSQEEKDLFAHRTYFGRKDGAEAKERFGAVLREKEQKKKSRWKLPVFVAMFLMLFAASYMWLPQAGYYPTFEDISEGNEDVFEMTPENTYILEKGGKRYTVFTYPDGKVDIDELCDESFEIIKEVGFEIRREEE